MSQAVMNQGPEGKEMEPIIDLNIVILPDEKVSLEAVRLSQRLSEEFNSFFTLDAAHIPHLSLYPARYPQKNRGALSAGLEKLASEAKRFPITLSGYSFFANFIYWNALVDDAYRRLHEQVVDTFNPLREGQITDVVRGIEFSDPEQLKNVEEFGNPLVKKLFSPHITLARLVEPSEVELALQSLSDVELKFEVSEIAIGPFAEHGTFPKALEVFQLH